MAKSPLNRTGSARGEQNWNNTHRNFQQVFWEVGMLAAACGSSCRFFNRSHRKALWNRLCALAWELCAAPALSSSDSGESEPTKVPPRGTIPNVMWVSSVSKQPCGYEAGPCNGWRAAGCVLGDVCYGFLFVFVFFQISLWINVLKQNFYFWSL